MRSSLLFAPLAVALVLGAARAEAGTPAQVASLALANDGGMACATNSLGGHSFFSSCTGNGGAPEYWCADFARWVWANSGAQFTSELTAAAGSFYVYGQNHGTLHHTPAVGDAVVFNYQGNGYADHVAIVTQVNSNGTIETISGDWGGQSGTEAQFSATSHVVINAPAFPGVVGSSPGVIGMTISGFISAVGLDAPYAAAFVSQSFPLASTALTMVEGQTIPSYIELKNTGTKTWDSSTRIATTVARDRASVFADHTWLSSSRLAAVTGTVPPGGTFKFAFNLHAPDAAGTYFEHFGVVQEGVAWFGDPSQGGPADDVLEAQIKVAVPEYRGVFKAQSFPTAPAALTVHKGDVVTGHIDVTNTGAQPWKVGTTKLAPIPRDKPSPFADRSWLSPTRVSTVAAATAPGAVGRFDVTLDASEVGDFEVTFGLLEEGVTWFADPNLGGGPADGVLRVHLVVQADADGGVSDGGAGDASTSGDAGAGAGGDAGAGGEAPSGDAGSAGGCAVTRRADDSAWGAVAIAAIAAIAARRRHRAIS